MKELVLALILKYSMAAGLDPALVAGVVATESSFNASSIGAAGEVGLMQIKPSTAMLPGWMLLNPETNIAVGTNYLALMAKMCRHKASHTFVICYNQGPGANVYVPEENAYYKKVMLATNKFRPVLRRMVEKDVLATTRF